MVIGIVVDVGRLEEVDIMIVMKGLYRYLCQMGKFAILEHDHDDIASNISSTCFQTGLFPQPRSEQE